MAKADDNYYRHSDLVVLQWWNETSVMPQMNKGGNFIFGKSLIHIHGKGGNADKLKG